MPMRALGQWTLAAVGPVSVQAPNGVVDVVVTDGFTGNIFVKTAEATAGLLQKVMLEELMAGFVNKVGAFLAKPALQRVRQRTDDSEFGGAVLLGLAGIVVVGHGRSKAHAILNAIRVAKQGVDHDILGEIQAGVNRATEIKPNTIAEAA